MPILTSLPRTLGFAAVGLAVLMQVLFMDDSVITRILGTLRDERDRERVKATLYSPFVIGMLSFGTLYIAVENMKFSVTFTSLLVAATYYVFVHKEAIGRKYFKDEVVTAVQRSFGAAR